MTTEEMLIGMMAEIVNKISAKVTEQVMEGLEGKLSDLLNDYDFFHDSSFSDSISATIRNEVEDLLSGASISL